MQRRGCMGFPIPQLTYSQRNESMHIHVYADDSRWFPPHFGEGPSIDTPHNQISCMNPWRYYRYQIPLGVVVNEHQLIWFLVYSRLPTVYLVVGVHVHAYGQPLNCNWGKQAWLKVPTHFCGVDAIPGLHAYFKVLWGSIVKCGSMCWQHTKKWPVHCRLYNLIAAFIVIQLCL